MNYQDQDWHFGVKMKKPQGFCDECGLSVEEDNKEL